MIYINKNRAGKLWNVAFGIAEILDGILRIASFGTLSSKFALEVSRQMAITSIRKQCLREQNS